MAFNPFLGQSQAQLETALAYAQADLASGKATTEVMSAGSGGRMQVDTSLIERIRLILSALNKLDPTTYPADQVAMATQTRASFS